jgi:S-adenosylmethionine hydrolase
VNLVTLTTDFGAADWFVGVMKGVILSVNPRATIVDITHDLPFGDVRAAAFAIACAYRFFPRDAVHVVVVDPGVGGDRKPIAVRTDDYWFVGPDNGVLSWAIARERIKAIYHLQNKRYFLREISSTFHGRDVFAPVAAHLSRGAQIRDLGRRLAEIVRLDWPEVVEEAPGRIRGEVVYLDRFGNAITNIPAQLLSRLNVRAAGIYARGKRLCPVAGCYSAVPAGRPVAVAGSHGCVEIAVNRGSAATRLHLSVGTRVTLREQAGRK